ncbi:hypothetical protein ACQYWQ_10890 [Streptomyces sp. P6-2-1]|uniref:hypothetical protein n=1 Tax=Streptomyces sp. P6-2-1 TaxID=3422591 RepID=UPI003D36B90D
MTSGMPRWNAFAQRWEHGGSTTVSPPPVPDAAPYVVAPAETAAPDPYGTVLPPVTWDPGPPPQQPSGRPRNKRALLLAAAVVVAAGAVALTWVLLDTGDEGPAEAHKPAGVSAAPDPTPGEEGDLSAPDPSAEEPSAEETSEETPSDDPSALPEGFVATDDPAGYGLAVPEDWERSEKDGSVFYTSPDELSLLQLFEITDHGLSPEDAVAQASEDLGRRTEQYEQITLGPTRSGPENPKGDAAELVYSYESDKVGGTRLGIERAFTATDGKRYAVLAAAPDTTETSQREVLETALAHFTPPGEDD